MVLKFMWRRDFLLQMSYLLKTEDSYLYFRLALLHLLSYFFFVYWSSCSCLWTESDAISSNIDEVLSVNVSGNVTVFGDFNVHRKDCLIYFGGSDRLGEIGVIQEVPTLKLGNFWPPPPLYTSVCFKKTLHPPFYVLHTFFNPPRTTPHAYIYTQSLTFYNDVDYE